MYSRFAISHPSRPIKAIECRHEWRMRADSGIVARMQPRARAHRQRNLATNLVLAFFLLRAYVPLGFMPASGAPLLLEICPQGLQVPAAAQHAHHNSGNHGHFENCPFGSAPASGPISHFVSFQVGEQVASAPVLAFATSLLGVKLQRAHQARAPPTVA
jgi:hypothetical protein